MQFVFLTGNVTDDGLSHTSRRAHFHRIRRGPAPPRLVGPRDRGRAHRRRRGAQAHPPGRAGVRRLRDRAPTGRGRTMAREPLLTDHRQARNLQVHLILGDRRRRRLARTVGARGDGYLKGHILTATCHNDRHILTFLSLLESPSCLGGRSNTRTAKSLEDVTSLDASLFGCAAHFNFQHVHALVHDEAEHRPWLGTERHTACRGRSGSTR